jgi:hypothetical protein
VTGIGAKANGQQACPPAGDDEEHLARRAGDDVPAQQDGADDAWERVGGDGHANEEAGVTGRGHDDRQPGDGHDAQPVAERRDPKPSKEPSRLAFRQQAAYVSSFMSGARPYSA